jgi:hypothetical protein
MRRTVKIDGDSWGVIRVARCSGRSNEEDAAAFDGWYGLREMALVVAKDWAARYPHWAVSVVRAEQSWLSKDFTTQRDYAWTAREARIVAGKWDDKFPDRIYRI